MSTYINDEINDETWGQNPRGTYLKALDRIAELEADRDAAFNKGMERAAKMTKHKIFYGQKWVNDNSVVLCSSKNRHSDPSLPMYEYIEYTKEVKESLESIAELKAERDRDRKDFIEINNVTVEDK